MSMTFEEWLSSYGKNRYKVTEYDLKMAWEASAAETEQALADSKAREGRYRDALEKLACLGNGDYYGNSDGNIIAQKALTQGETEERSSKP